MYVETAVAYRGSVKTSVLRRCQHWIKQGKDIQIGPSGKTIYVDRKQLSTKEDIEKTIASVQNSYLLDLPKFILFMLYLLFILIE